MDVALDVALNVVALVALVPTSSYSLALLL
jgi:hypothetical protein